MIFPWLSSARLLVAASIMATIVRTSLGAPLDRDVVYKPRAVTKTKSIGTNDTVEVASNTTSAGAFPICTDSHGTFSPFCLPHNGADVIVDASYYVTWNADFFPLNATITIELRYPNSSEGDSAYTSDRTANSYGYIPLRMRKEWLQGKQRNSLTLYIIELDSSSDKRARARQGPTVTLHPKPVEHYQPPPPLPFNKLALIIGLPVSLGVVILIVAGLFFGMRRSRKIGVEHAKASRGKGYGIGKSKNERLSKTAADYVDDLKKYSDLDEGMSEVAESNMTDLYQAGTRVAKLKSWSDS